MNMPKTAIAKIMNLYSYFFKVGDLPCILQKAQQRGLKFARRLNSVLLAAAPERGLIDAEKVGCIL